MNRRAFCGMVFAAVAVRPITAYRNALFIEQVVAMTRRVCARADRAFFNEFGYWPHVYTK